MITTLDLWLTLILKLVALAVLCRVYPRLRYWSVSDVQEEAPHKGGIRCKHCRAEVTGEPVSAKVTSGTVQEDYRCQACDKAFTVTTRRQ